MQRPVYIFCSFAGIKLLLPAVLLLCLTSCGPPTVERLYDSSPVRKLF
jgi:hypothetical protein